MDRLRGLWSRFRSIVNRRAAERELGAELRFHIERETDAGIARGLGHQDARRHALLRFGGVERFREEARDARGITWFDEARADLTHGWRLLLAHPLFTVAAVLTLALGIGANTAISSVVNAVLLQRSPFRDPARLVMIWETDRGSGTHREPASWPDIADFRERSRSFSAIAALVATDVTLTGSGEPLRAAALYVTPNLLDMLGVHPVAGRLFQPTDGTVGDPFAQGATVAILGEEFWRSQFNGDRSVIGRTITVDGHPVTILGVVPRSTDLGILQIHRRADYALNFSGEHVALWLAARPTVDAFPRSTHPFLTVGRLAPGATLRAAQTEMASIASDIERHDQVNKDRGVNLEGFDTVIFGTAWPALLMLLGAVMLVLLVTCANVANLLLARTATRVREVALRRAMGARPGRLARQFLAESLLLVMIGTIAGVALAFVAVRLLVVVAPADIPRLDAATVNGRVLGYAAAIAALVAVIFGMLPVAQTRRVDIQQTLKSHGAGRVAGHRGTRSFRRALVVSEVAMAVMLVVGAGILVRSFARLQAVNPGFNATSVLKAQLQLPNNRYPVDFKTFPDEPELNAFTARLLAAVRAIPGVESAALSNTSPLESGFTNSFAIVGREAESATYPEIRIRFVSPGDLRALGVPLLEGRDVTDGDGVRSTPVILINHTAALRYFPHGAIGQQIKYWGVARQIVGVIGDEKFRGLDAPVDPAVYVPMGQAPSQSITVMARVGRGDPTSVAGGLRQAVHAIDPQIPLYGVEPLRAAESATIARPRFNALLLTIFALVAMLLAIVGVHGVLSYMVAERGPEIGIRMALGASRQAVMRDVVSDGVWLAVIGVAVGLAAALAASRMLSSFVFGVTSTDLTTFVVVPIAVLATAVAASVMPALRATRVDPMRSLRAE